MGGDGWIHPFCFVLTFDVCSSNGVLPMESKIKCIIINNLLCSHFLLVNGFLMIKRDHTTATYFYIKILILY